MISTTDEAQLPPQIHKVWRSTYYHGLQAMRSFAADPGSPNFAAVLSFLFQEEGTKNPATQLQTWLHGFISPSVGGSLRDQADQLDKTIAVAAYLTIVKYTHSGHELPDSDLIDYVEYAERQDWFGDPFLAFYCHTLRSDIVACVRAQQYFVSNFERFLAKRHLPSICQSLIVLGDSLPPNDITRALAIADHCLQDRTPTLLSVAWTLWAFATSSNPSARLRVCELANTLEVELSEHLAELGHQADGPQPRIVNGHRHNSNAPAGDAEAEWGAVDTNAGADTHSEDMSLAQSERILLSPLDVALALVALRMADEHQIVGVVARDEAQLVAALEQAHALRATGSAVLTRPALLASNLLVVVATLAVGFFVILYFLGGLRVANQDYLLTLGLTGLSRPDISLFLFVVAAWLDLLLGQLVAIACGKPAIEVMIQLPLLRHLMPLLRNAESRRKEK